MIGIYANFSLDANGSSVVSHFANSILVCFNGSLSIFKMNRIRFFVYFIDLVFCCQPDWFLKPSIVLVLFCIVLVRLCVSTARALRNYRLKYKE